jgi:parvulin-like peptidyl-prolyl isomerase
MAMAFLTGGCGGRKQKVVVNVNQQPITKQQLWDALEKAENGDMSRQVLHDLILRRLIHQKAAERKIEVSDKEIDKRIDGSRPYVLAETGKDLETWLADTDQSMDELRERARYQTLQGKLVIPEADRKAYWEANKQRFKDLPHNNEAVIYRQIVVSTEDEAKATLKKLKTNEQADFAKIAAEVSTDGTTRDRGGMAGWVVKGKMAPVDPKLEEVVFSIKPGEISQPIRSPDRTPDEMSKLLESWEQMRAEAGLPKATPDERAAVTKTLSEPRWRIVKVEEHFPPHKLMLEDNVQWVEKFMMEAPEFQAALQQFLDGLLAEATIDFVDPLYSSLGQEYESRRRAQQQMMTPGASPIAPGAPNQSLRPSGDASGRAAPRPQGSRRSSR